MSPWLIFLFPILTQGWIGYFSLQDGATSVKNYANVKTHSEDPKKVIDIHRNDPEELFNKGLKFLDRKVEEFVKRMPRRKPVSGKIRLLRKK